MFQSAALELTNRIQHSHGEGDWHDMTEVTASHDAAEADPERAWQGGRVFRCSTCESEIRIVGLDTEPPSQRP